MHGDKLPTRIDVDTLEILINEEHSDSRRSRASRPFWDRDYFSVSGWFASTLREGDYLNPIERTNPPSPKEKKLDLIDIFDTATLYNMMEIDALHYDPYRDTDSFDVFRSSKTPFFELMRKRTKHKVIKAYDSLFTRQPKSIEEARKRQYTFRELVENHDLFEGVYKLEKALHHSAEPLLHLEDMSYLICADLLKSRLAKPIHGNEFYSDFMALSRQFTGLAEIIASVLPSLASSSQESQETRQILKQISPKYTDPESPAKKAIDFLNLVVKENPRDYEELRAYFGKWLKSRSTTLNNELEQLDDKHDFNKEMGPVDMLYYPEPYNGPELRRLKGIFYSSLPLANSGSDLRLNARLSAFRAAAELFRKEKWILPDLLSYEEGKIQIVNGWHPLTDSRYEKGIIRNNTLIDDSTLVEICDGPNAQGKTTEMRKTLTIAALANLGMYVPAEHSDKRTQISFFPYIRCRIKSTGLEGSAFKHELEGLEYLVFPFAQEGLLFGFDEGLTSTNPLEGEALLYGTIRFLLDRGTRMILTSHYPSLHDLQSRLGIKFSHFDYSIKGGEIISNHQKQNGPNPRPEYAITMAEQKRLNPLIVSKAYKFSRMAK